VQDLDSAKRLIGKKVFLPFAGDYFTVIGYWNYRNVDYENKTVYWKWLRGVAVFVHSSDSDNYEHSSENMNIQTGDENDKEN